MGRGEACSFETRTAKGEGKLGRRAIASMSPLALFLVGLVATPALATQPVRETFRDVFGTDFYGPWRLSRGGTHGSSYP